MRCHLKRDINCSFFGRKEMVKSAKYYEMFKLIVARSHPPNEIKAFDQTKEILGM